jgi:hypothetical protein
MSCCLLSYRFAAPEGAEKCWAKKGNIEGMLFAIALMMLRRNSTSY